MVFKNSVSCQVSSRWPQERKKSQLFDFHPLKEQKQSLEVTISILQWRSLQYKIRQKNFIEGVEHIEAHKLQNC